MDHDSSYRSGMPPDGSPPSEAWLFAQAILGNPISQMVSPRVKALTERRELKRRAQFSTRHAQELRAVESAEAEAHRQRELLEWAARISTEAEDKLRALQREEAEEREGWRRAEQFTERLLEANWDSSQHPRAPKGQPDGGQWVAKGAGGGPGSEAPATGASYSNSKKVDVQQVSWPPPVGHHWVPVGVTQLPDIRPYLSDEAVQYAAGAFTGPTDPPHGNATYGEIPHPKYSAEVKKELEAFIAQRKIKKMTVAQMEEFVGLMKKGLGAAGKPNSVIGSFNKAVKGMVPKGTTAPSKMEDILDAGRTHMKHSRFKVLAAGAVISGILGEVINQQVKILEVASASGHYRKALRALHDGDLTTARSLLIGDHDSLYNEILGQLGAHAALSFKTAVERVFKSAKNRDYK